ncbi:MAG TPA: GMC oxidoreductase [Thermoleophilaceae bacterium]|jgi:cholesterol oxidase
MASFDYDVVIVGSGFGGSVAALRAAEKGYRVGVMESGKRWKDEEIPKTQWNLPKFLWLPAAELYGIQRIEYLDDVLVLCGAGVGGGSHVYANTLYVPPKQFFDAPEWADITDWAEELAPCLDQATRMLGVVRYPYMPTDVDRALLEVATEIGRGETFNKAPVGVYFGSPGVEAEDPYFGGVGPRRTGCISCGNCNIGCGHNAKNKLTTNYLYLAERVGAQVHELHEVHDLVPLDGGGFEVHTRHPGWAQRAAHVHRHTYTAEQVIVAAHAYGSAKLLHHMQHEGRLTGLSSQLGQRARTNSEQLLYVTRSHGEWKADPEKVHITPGCVTITSGVWPDAKTSVEPTNWGVGSDIFALLGTYHQHGEQEHSFESWLKELVAHPGEVLAPADPSHWSERSFVALCMQTTDTSIELYWADGLLRSRPSGTPPPVHSPVIEDFVDRVAAKLDSGEAALLTEVINRNASAHFVGGIPIGDDSDSGAVDPYLRLFGQPGMHVMDGSVMPANPGVNPSLMITALAERAMSLWPNKGEEDVRPPLGSGYERLDPIMPHRPVVPAGAPGELRLDAKKADLIPEYPY